MKSIKLLNSIEFENERFDDVANEYLKAKVKKVRTRIFNFKETTIDRHNRKYALLANLPRIRIHDFRHSNITYLTYKNFTPMEICERTGHKDKTIIVNKYSHLINTYQKQIVDCIDKDFK